MRTLILCAAAVVLLLPTTSLAVSIEISADGVGPLTSGIGVKDGTGLSDLTVLVSLSETTNIAAYDLTVSWDPAEVALASAVNLFNPGSFFFVTPVGGDSTGTRIADLSTGAIETDDLFSLTFSLLSPLINDGGAADAADIAVSFVEALNGDPFSPSSVTLDNPNGAGIDVVPEPSTALLLGAGLVASAAATRRSRRWRV